MAYRIFLVEDNEELGQLLKTYLSREGFDVSYFKDGSEAERNIEKEPDIWVLDVMLPGINGFEVMRHIKMRYPQLPVILISARDKELDRVLGLELGCDDYIAKPFLPRELVIRVRRILERCTRPKEHKEKTYKIENYIISKEGRSVTENGSEIILTSKELDLLLVLLSNPGNLLSRDKLLSRIWGEDYYGSDRVVDNLVRRLRKKMPRLNIETVYGEGYRIIV